MTNTIIQLSPICAATRTFYPDIYLRDVIRMHKAMGNTIELDLHDLTASQIKTYERMFKDTYDQHFLA